VLLALVLGACDRGPSRTLTASAYDRACESARDCIPVFDGHVASCQAMMECPNAAVAKDAYVQYLRDVDGALAPCTESLSPVCIGGVVTCPAGQCAFRAFGAETAADTAARAVSADDYAQTCETVDDCVPVYAGPLGCCDHGCANAVISTIAMSQYESDVAHRTPECFPRSPCEALAPCTDGPRVDCRSNHCVLLTLTK
jgi:hypothetical protein